MTIRFRPPIKTIAELLHHLGDIPAERVKFDPVPGTAVLDDLLKPENCFCELVDGTLVEKAVGSEESFLGARLLTLLNIHVHDNNLGMVTGEQGFYHLPDGPVRGPDVAFTSWASLPDRRRYPRTVAFPPTPPDLVVEVVSPGNTTREMARKRGEYFRSGVRLVWEIDPGDRTVRVYTAEDRFRELSPADALDGADVLPGLLIPIADLFAELDRHG